MTESKKERGERKKGKKRKKRERERRERMKNIRKRRISIVSEFKVEGRADIISYSAHYYFRATKAVPLSYRARWRLFRFNWEKRLARISAKAHLIFLAPRYSNISDS